MVAPSADDIVGRPPRYVGAATAATAWLTTTGALARSAAP